MKADILMWLMIVLSGLLLGLIFYGGLWWTTHRGLTARHPGLLFFVSMLVRTAVVLTGFYLISAGQWQRILVCLAGFTLARLVVLQYTKKKTTVPLSTKKENHGIEPG